MRKDIKAETVSERAAAQHDDDNDDDDDDDDDIYADAAGSEHFPESCN